MAGYENQDSIKLAQQAERDLNSHAIKTGKGIGSDSANESGVDQSVEYRFPGASVTYGSARDIPESEGGGRVKIGGVERQAKARDLEGVGGPEDKAELERESRGGDVDVDSATRQGQAGGGEGSVRVSGGK